MSEGNKQLFHIKKHCVVIGTTHMCISVLELLQKHCWNILCVVSKDLSVIDYCKKNEIKILKGLKQVEEKGFILFSVINYSILSEDFLRSHKVKYAINYHDSLLPKYGGVNSTTWAICNEESIHGVSWHLISSKIDEGDLVKQSSFAIDPNETAFSLNLKCSTEALRLFSLLLEDFDSGYVFTKKQDLRNKTYFDRNKIPENYGIINFNDSLKKIYSTHRSLYLGGKSYCNPVGSVKIWDGSEFFLIDSLAIVKDKKTIPGKVYTSSDSSLLIGVSDGKIAINNIKTSEGEKVCINNTSFHENSVITPYCISQKEKEVLEKIKKSEGKLLDEFFSDDSYQDPFFDVPLVDANTDQYHRSFSFNKNLDCKAILSRIFLGLLGYIGRDVCIPVKSIETTKSKLFSNFIFKMNLIRLEISQRDLTYGNFVNFITSGLEEGLLVPKDLLFRYRNRCHIDKIRDNLEVVYSKKSLPLGKQRMRITLIKGRVHFDGYEQDKAIIDLIYSFIKYAINDVTLINGITLKDFFERSANKEGNPFYYHKKNRLAIDHESINSAVLKEYPSSFLETFEKQALYQPNSLALTFEDKKLNYDCLNKKANQFARYLKEKGAESGSLVGIGLSRSDDLIIALLGVMKAGCTYIPLDPSHPAQRIHFILEDAGVDYFITKASHKSLFKKHHGKLILFDEERNEILKQEETTPKRGIPKDHLAYVLYTSGSTGTPKGVEVFESALDNLIYSVQKQIQCTAKDRWLALTTISFDISILEICLPLTQGAAVVLASDKSSKDPQAITRLIDKAKITIAQATPSMWQMIIDGKWKGKTGLKALSGGEALPKNLAKELLKRGVRLWNLYGPTETTVWSSMEKVTASDEVITIGRPIDNTEFYVLDDRQQIQPIGVPGELYIGGAGLAKGYLNRKELTESKFISSPFGRLYGTGDLVCRLQDGRFEYIGRLDHQIKIRGFRVELGEIEEVLRKIKGISQVVVVTHEVKPGDLRLVAYFQGEASQSDLEVTATSFLPSYMHPNTYIKVREFPLTPNQKIDRNALPSPVNIEEDGRYIAPKSVYEKQIANIFERYLGLEKVSVDTNFFSLGGHSLLVVQVISEINKSFCIDLPLTSLFEHPSVKTLGLQVESALKLGGSHDLSIRRYPKKKSYELSSSQLRIWFSEQLAPTTSLYSIPQVLEMSGTLNMRRFRKAIKAVFEKHEILRAVFREKSGEIRQIIKGISKSPLQCLDYSGERFPEEKAKRMFSSEAKKGFDLKNGPLARFIIIRVSNRKHLFFFNFHHIIFDGLSTNLLLQDICSFYEGEDIKVSKQPQYVDYISWKIKDINESSKQTSIEFLKKKLKGISLTPFLPNDKKRPKALTFQGSCLRFVIKKSHVEKIHLLIRENNVTFFSFMLAAFHILLSRYSSQKEFVIGVPSSGRDNVSLDSMIGCFINILPFPTSSKGDKTFVDLLKRFSREGAELFKHQEVPFDRLANELNIDRSAAYSPVFQVMLNMLPRISVKKMGSLELNLKQIERGMSHFDLSLTMQEASEGVAGFLEYSTELFSRKIAAAISRHFQSLIKEIVMDPNQTISQLQFLSQQEIENISLSWNSSNVEYSGKETIIKSFEGQVDRTPQQTALICGNEQLSYAELNREANKIAHLLLEKGIKPENRVAVCLDRTKEFIIAVLGVLKSGAAYVPIDPMEPRDRIRSVFDDLGPSYVITHSRVKLKISHPNVLCMDQVGSLDTHNPSIRNLEHHLAYIIYTSGSTGKPKGVEIEHGSINDRVMWKKAAYPLSTQDVMLHTYSFIFDGAIINYFWPLCTGATLLIANSLEQYDPSALVQLIQKHKVSVSDMLPSLIRGLVEVKGFDRCTSLRHVFSGGEALSGEVIQMFYKNCSSAKLHNTYGPTEVTVEASVWECDPNFSDTVAPIGRPIAGAKLCVLDEYQNVVPTGVQGELYIGGLGVARSYLNDPELTKKKFIKNPFGIGRLYRTGDLVRRNFKDELEFLGRVDHQVKIRGYRVELGEIEASLLRMDQVERVAVVAKGKDIHKKLVAYVQLSPRMEVLTFQSLMQQFLGKRLPRHMIPSQVVVLKSLPILLNGKINYKALPEPEKNATPSPKSKEKPTSTEEIKLLNLWKELLDFADLSINDNFFEVGGNSLLAMRLITRVNKEMNVSLPLITLFHHPTIKLLASSIKTPTKQKTNSSAVLMKGQGTKTPFFCVHPVGGNILCYNNLAKHWSDDRPLYALQARGFEGKERPLKSIKSIAREYIKSIKKIQKNGPYLIGGWSFGGHVASEIARQLVEQGDAIRVLVLIDTSANIDEFRKIDINSESALYSELLDHYSVNTNNDHQDLSPKERLIQLLEWGDQKKVLIEENRLNRTLNVAKSNYRALQKYSVSPVKNVPVVLLKAENSLEGPNDLGWAKYVDMIEVHSMPGNHWGIVNDSLSKVYALTIQRSIKTALEKQNLVGMRR